MNKYLMRIEGYFFGWKEFEIEAENKQDAIIKGKEYCRIHPEYGYGGNYKHQTIKVVKKLRR